MPVMAAMAVMKTARPSHASQLIRTTAYSSLGARLSSPGLFVYRSSIHTAAQEVRTMKAFLSIIFLSLVMTTAANAQAVKCDMTQYKASSGLTAAVEQD